MELYHIASDHWVKDLRRAWLVLVRAECRCGHVTRPYLTLDGAANALVRHQVKTGTRVA
jgi:hypothetical protein